MACVIGSHVSCPAMHCGASDAQKIAQRHVTRLAPTPRHTTHRTGGGARRRTGHFRTHGVEHDRWHDRVNGALRGAKTPLGHARSPREGHVLQSPHWEVGAGAELRLGSQIWPNFQNLDFVRDFGVNRTRVRVNLT